MSADFASFAARLKHLDRALAALEPAAASIGLSAPRQDEWFQLLTNKLLPQLVCDFERNVIRNVCLEQGKLEPFEQVFHFGFAYRHVA